MMNRILNRIEVNPKIMLGKPVIRGTSIPVEIILRKLSHNISVDEILVDYPNLTIDDIKAAIAYASEALSADEILTVTGRR
ncbi:MAG: DUF433 domain-containing protein [Candidatus Edwardsbacteria bacterium]